jgi:excisionase family DNA binding protein
VSRHPENKKRPGEGASRKQFGAEGSAPAPIVDQRLFRTKGAADYLGISPRTLWTLTNLGKLRSVRFNTGGRESVRYDVADLDAWIEAQKSGGSQ